MKQLTVGNVLAVISDLKKDGMSLGEIYDLPIYIGDDDELNGIHCAWGTDLIDANNTNDEGNMYIVEMINERRGNFEIKGKAILIS